MFFSFINAQEEVIKRNVSIGVGENNLFSSFLNRSIAIQIDGDEIEVTSDGFGSNLLGEDIEYDDQNFGDENIFYKMIENKELEFDEDVWIDGFYLLDNLAVKVRFLFYEITEKDNKTKLYRFDIYEKNELEGQNRINNVILNSDIIKVWYNEEEKRLKKISLTFKSINYIINFDDEKLEFNNNLKPNTIILCCPN